MDQSLQCRDRQCRDGTWLDNEGELQLVLQDRHEMAHDKEVIDRRGDRLPGRELRDQSRTDLAGLRVKVELKDEQQKLVEVENPYQSLMNLGHNVNPFKKR